MTERAVSRAIIYDDRYRVLLGKRGRGMGEGLWALIGGKPDGDEKPGETIRREVLEELGVTYEAAPFKEEVEDAYDPAGEPWTVSYFAGKIIGTLAVDAAENSEVGFFRRDELAGLPIAFGHERILEEFFESIEV